MTSAKFVPVSWLRRALWLLGPAVAVLVVLAVLPAMLKMQLEDRGSAALGRAVHVETVDLQLSDLQLTLSGIHVATLDGRGEQLTVARLQLQADWASVLRGEPVFNYLRVDMPRLLLTHQGQGHFDVDDIVARLQTPADARVSQPLQFAVHNLAVHGGELDFVDLRQGTKLEHRLRKLQVALPLLSNLPQQQQAPMQLSLAFELNGSAVETELRGSLFGPNRQGRASLNINRLDLRPFLAYVPAGLPLKLQAGVLDAGLQLAFDEARPRQWALSGTLGLGRVGIADGDGTPWLSLGEVRAVLSDVRPLARQVQLASLDVQAPLLHLRRGGNGELQLPGRSPVQVNPSASAAGPVVQGAGNAANAEVAGGADAGGWQVDIAQLNLQDGRLEWQDDAPGRPVRMALAQARLRATGLHWPMTQQSLGWDASMLLQTGRAPGAPGARVTLQGRLGGAGSQASGSVEGLNLADFAPYLAPYLEPRLRGLADARLQAQWQEGAFTLSVPHAVLRDAALEPLESAAEAGGEVLASADTSGPRNAKVTNGAAARDSQLLGLLEIQGAELQWPQHRARVAKILLRQPALRLRHEATGQWNFSHWLKPAKPQHAPPQTLPLDTAQSGSAATDTAPQATASSASAPPAATIPWDIQLQEVRLEDASLTFSDRVPAKPVRVVLSSLNGQLRDLSLDGRQPARVTLAGKVRTARTEAGTLAFDGLAMWNPVLLQGVLDAADVPVHALMPYLGLDSQVELQRAEVGYSGQLRIANLPQGTLVQAQGEAALNDVRVSTAAASTASAGEAKSNGAAEELMRWKTLSLAGLDFSMAPASAPSLRLDGLSLSDFFARLTITPQGHLQLLDLLQPAERSGPAQASGPAAQFHIGPMHLRNGRVAFSDRFIQPNYSATLTELEGSLSGFSSQPLQPPGTAPAPAMADLKLRGRAEGSASIEIVGQLQPLGRPPVMDIKGLVRDLDLSPLSSYAIKYAGYGIERGKLNMDVSYRINPDGELTANNKLVLHQLSFGEKAEGASQSLPVKLAATLLADRNGVIDLDIPVSGSLNDPQFSVWPVAWKFLGQLIAKALISPFSLLGNNAGSQDLATVAFEPGSDRMPELALRGLDQVAQVLKEKPSLDLIVTGSASLQQEQAAIRRERLNALLRAELGSAAGAAQPALGGLGSEDYARLVSRVFRQSDLRRPRAADGSVRELSTREMESMLADSLAVDEGDVRELANARALAVREALKARQVAPGRLFLGAARTAGLPADWSARAELTLTGF